jgi:hypothetical protein
MWLEIFRTGEHTDSNGRSHSYTPEALDLIAAKYNSQILDDPSREAPVVKGHPQTDSPAFGWVNRLARRGDRLVASIRNIDDEFAGEVRSGKFRNVSISLNPDMTLRHVGFLGAAPPAVKDLLIPEFSESDSDLSYQLINNNNADDNELLEENNRLRQELELVRKEQRLGKFRDFAQSLVNHRNGSRVTPGQADIVVDLLEMADRDCRSSSSDYNEAESRVHELMEFFKSLKPAFDTSEFAARNFSAPSSEGEFRGVHVSDSRINLHEAARQLQKDTPGLSYEEAVLIAQKNIH